MRAAHCMALGYSMGIEPFSPEHLAICARIVELSASGTDFASLFGGSLPLIHMHLSKVEGLVNDEVGLYPFNANNEYFVKIFDKLCAAAAVATSTIVAQATIGLAVWFFTLYPRGYCEQLWERFPAFSGEALRVQFDQYDFDRDHQSFKTVGFCMDTFITGAGISGALFRDGDLVLSRRIWKLAIDAWPKIIEQSESGTTSLNLYHYELYAGLTFLLVGPLALGDWRTASDILKVHPYGSLWRDPKAKELMDDCYSTSL